jgi:hypothetical protein
VCNLAPGQVLLNEHFQSEWRRWYSIFCLWAFHKIVFSFFEISLQQYSRVFLTTTGPVCVCMIHHFQSIHKSPEKKSTFEIIYLKNDQIIFSMIWSAPPGYHKFASMCKTVVQCPQLKSSWFYYNKVALRSLWFLDYAWPLPLTMEGSGEVQYASWKLSPFWNGSF